MIQRTAPTKRGGFTLMETVIAIGVLAVLLTAFLAVFGPAAQNIRRAISVQEADRLAYTLESELVTLRKGEESDYSTGFHKAFDWIQEATDDGEPILIYQYRGDISRTRSDGTAEPYSNPDGVAGQQFVVQPMVRKRDDPELEADLRALEGRVYTVKLTQLVFNGGALELGSPGKIEDPTPGDGDTGGGGSGADGYPEAVIAFAAEFFIVPNTAPKYIQDKLDLGDLKTPVFTRNLAVRR